MSGRDVNVSLSGIISFNNWDLREEGTVGEARGSNVHQSVAFDLVNATVSGRGSNVSGISTPDNGNLLEGLIVPLYAIIFLLSVIGNCLVLVTLARNKRMRTVTNVYLLNLVRIIHTRNYGVAIKFRSLTLIFLIKVPMNIYLFSYRSVGIDHRPDRVSRGKTG